MKVVTHEKEFDLLQNFNLPWRGTDREVGGREIHHTTEKKELQENLSEGLGPQRQKSFLPKDE